MIYWDVSITVIHLVLDDFLFSKRLLQLIYPYSLSRRSFVVLVFYHCDSAYFRTSCCCVHRKKTTGRSLRTLRARQAAAPQYEFVQRFHVRMLWTLYQCQPSQVEDVGCHFRRITPGDSGSDMYHIRGY